MEDSQEILLSSLQKAGVSLSNDVFSVRDLAPATLVSICAQCLNILDETSPPLPTSLPDSMVDRFKICTDLALATKRLGYIGDITYYKFLYPSEEDLYSLVRFFVERLSDSSSGAKISGLKDVTAEKKNEEDDSSQHLAEQMERADNDGVAVDYLRKKVEEISLPDEMCKVSQTGAEDASFSRSRTQNFGDDKINSTISRNLLAEEGMSGRGALSNEEKHVVQGGDMYVQEVNSHNEEASKIRYKKEELENEENVLMEELAAKNIELQHLEKEFELLKAAADMAFDKQHSVDFYLEQLNEQVYTRKCNIVELESLWDAFREPLEEKKKRMEESLYANIPEAEEKLQKLREVKLAMQSVLAEIRRREEEHSKLSADLEKQPKLQSRKSYIDRIKEITKNSRKQDADIEQILEDTRELQLESNSIQERLHRTYAVLDEIVFREAKKDPVGRQAYRLLTRIHEIFEQISEKILAADRIQREAANYEKKLSAMASRSLNIDKLQADLDAIVKENEQLEQQQLQDS